jgi:hypothetical protein
MNKKQFLTTLIAGLSVPSISFSKTEERQIGTEVIRWANQNVKGLSFKEGKNNVEWILNQAWHNHRVTGYRGCGMTFASILLAGYLAQTQKVLMVVETKRTVGVVKKQFERLGISTQNIDICGAYSPKETYRGSKYDVCVVTQLPNYAPKKPKYVGRKYYFQESWVNCDKFIRIDNYDEPEQFFYKVYSNGGYKKYSMDKGNESWARLVYKNLNTKIEIPTHYPRIF